MKRAALFLLMVATNAVAQSDGVAEANVAYGRCVVAHAKILAGVKELPKDIADAAFGYCTGERAAFMEALQSALQKAYGRRVGEAETMVDAAERQMRRAALRAILETRYPSLK